MSGDQTQEKFWMNFEKISSNALLKSVSGWVDYLVF